MCMIQIKKNYFTLKRAEHNIENDSFSSPSLLEMTSRSSAIAQWVESTSILNLVNQLLNLT